MGLTAWLKQRQEASIQIKKPSGTIIAKNLTGHQALDLAALLANDPDHPADSVLPKDK
jgi:hypothetical protein